MTFVVLIFNIKIFASKVRFCHGYGMQFLDYVYLHSAGVVSLFSVFLVVCHLLDVPLHLANFKKVFSRLLIQINIGYK